MKEMIMNMGAVEMVRILTWISGAVTAMLIVAIIWIEKVRNKENDKMIVVEIGLGFAAILAIRLFLGLLVFQDVIKFLVEKGGM